ncbi:MAG: polysulfide reductase NrfD [Myxococcales bacterium]|nr:polysulfide reductase NrfD [Myxococcales bacterium]
MTEGTMAPHIEIETTRNAALASAERVWGWEIPIYLFLGGLVAGLMLAVSVSILLLGRARVTQAMRRGVVAAPVLLSLGMGALFLDLTYKLHVFRFYTTFQATAPMSIGSWVLLLVYPVQLGLILALPADLVEPWLDRAPFLGRARRWAEAHVRGLAWGGLVLGVALGVYTGVLLSATVARPLWSSGALGFLFLASGASTGVAALMVLERDHEMQGIFARADLALIAAELLVLSLWLVGLVTQGPIYREAAASSSRGPTPRCSSGWSCSGGSSCPRPSRPSRSVGVRCTHAGCRRWCSSAGSCCGSSSSTRDRTSRS